jgi:hypothetical protein
VPGPTAKWTPFSSLLRRGALYFAIALGSGLNVAPAAAISTGEVADTVGSAVAPVTAPLPQPPQGEPPAQDPADPVKSAAGTTPSPGGEPAGDAAAGMLGATTHLPSGGGAAGSEGNLPETAAETLTEAARRASPSDHGGLGAARNPDGTDRASSAGSGKSSFQSAKAAPPRRLIAYVWPAIALWPGARPLTALLVSATEADSPPMAKVARILASASGPTGARSDSALPSRPSSPSSPNGSPVGAAASTGAKILLYIGTAALLAMLAMAIRKELDPAPRPPDRRR